MGTFKPVNVKDLTIKDKERALESLMFLEEKRSGKIKGRICADGRKQRLEVKKGAATSPTVSLEALFITSVI